MCRELHCGEIAVGALKLLAGLDLEKKVLRAAVSKIHFSQSFHYGIPDPGQVLHHLTVNSDHSPVTYNHVTLLQMSKLRLNNLPGVIQ